VCYAVLLSAGLPDCFASCLATVLPRNDAGTLRHCEALRGTKQSNPEKRDGNMHNIPPRYCLNCDSFDFVMNYDFYQ
jgi:hypothetical protein